MSLPDDDPVYTLKKVMEDLDFSGLLANCSDKGRTGYNRVMMYEVITYANMRGIRSIDRIVDLCERDIAFIRLTQGRKPKRDAFYEFKGKKLTSDILDNLNYQFMRRLQKEGLVTLKELFIDGTKIEANANRCTFVWRGSINYHLAGLPDSIDKLYSDYNSFLQDNGFGEKYEFGNAQMFVIDGIDNCSSLEILKLQKNLMTIADGEGIVFVNGKGKRKPKLQQLYEELEHCGQRLMGYKECFEIYICHDGRELRYINTEKKEQNGYTQTYEVYGCSDCSGCDISLNAYTNIILIKMLIRTK